MSITKKIRTKFLSLMLVLSVVITGLIPTTAVFASEITEPGTAVSTAVLTSEGLIMNVTVPTSVLIYVDENGEVTTPDYLPIINNSIAPVFVHSLTVTPKNGWTLDPIATDYTNFKTNRKNYWIALNGLDPSSEPIALATPIYGSDSLNLVLSADVAPQRTATTALNIGEIVVISDWDAAEGAQEVDMTYDYGLVGASYTAPKSYVLTVNALDTGSYIVGIVAPGAPTPAAPPQALASQPIMVEETGVRAYPVTFSMLPEDIGDADIYLWKFDFGSMNYVGPKKAEIRGVEIIDQPEAPETPEVNFEVHSITHGDEGKLSFSMTVESPGVAEFAMVPAGSTPPANGTSSFNLNSAGYQEVNVEIYGGYDGSIDYDIYVWIYDAEWNLVGPVKVLLAAYGSETGGGDSGHTGVVPEGYTLATDEDFSGDSLYNFKYIGSHEYVVIPYVIKGVPVTAYSSMFSDQSTPTVKGVYSDNPNVTNMYHLFGNFGYAAPTSELEFYLDTTNVTNMSRMFDNARLDSLDLSDLDVSNVTNMQHMLSQVEVPSLDFSGWNTSKVTNMDGMFQFNKVPTLDLTSFNTANVTDMGSMFWGAEAATLNLTSFNTSKVTDMANMFQGAKATTLNLTKFDTSNVIDMSYMFQEAEATTLDLTNFDTDNVSYMNSMFNGARATTIDISSFKLADTQPTVYAMFTGAEATTVYVRSQADIDYLVENAGDIPATINFVIK